MSGSDSTTQNQTQVSQPWTAAQPFLQDIMGQAQALYNKGGQYAPFNTVAPFSPETETGLQLTADRAINGSPLIGTANQSLTNLLQAQTAPGSSALLSLLNQQGQPNPIASNLNNIPGQGTLNYIAQSGGSNAPLNDAASLIAGQANANPNVNPASQYLSSQASDASINPYLKSMFDAAASPVTDAVNAQFGLAGRTGSGANQQLLTRDLGNLASNIYGTNYNQARALQQSAAGQIQNAYDTGANRSLSASGALGNIGQNMIGNQAGAASTLGSQGLSAQSLLAQLLNNQNTTTLNAANSLNSGQGTIDQQKLQAAGLAPTLAGQDYTDLQNLLSVGNARDTQAQAQINDLQNRWNYGQNTPWDLLSKYSGAVSGLGNLGGTTTGSSSVSQPSTLLPSLVGGGLSLIGSGLGQGGWLSSLLGGL